MIEESMDKPTLAVHPKDHRKRLFSVLDGIISFADEKRILKGNSDRTKQNWSRIAVSAIQAYGSLLRDSDLEQLNTRLEALEQKQELEEYR